MGEGHSLLFVTIRVHSWFTRFAFVFSAPLLLCFSASPSQTAPPRCTVRGMKWFRPLLCFCVTIAVAACDRDTGTNTAPARARVQVLAVVHPLADVARRVAGPHADVQW